MKELYKLIENEGHNHFEKLAVMRLHIVDMYLKLNMMLSVFVSMNLLMRPTFIPSIPSCWSMHLRLGNWQKYCQFVRWCQTSYRLWNTSLRANRWYLWKEQGWYLGTRLKSKKYGKINILSLKMLECSLVVLWLQAGQLVRNNWSLFALMAKWLVSILNLSPQQKYKSLIWEKVKLV